MIQKPLLSTEVMSARAVNLEGISAMFTEGSDGVYDVVLEINSQKFLVKMCNGCNGIENFEVIATKWFVYDLTNNLVLTLKNLVECLWFRLN